MNNWYVKDKSGKSHGPLDERTAQYFVMSCKWDCEVCSVEHQAFVPAESSPLMANFLHLKPKKTQMSAVNVGSVILLVCVFIGTLIICNSFLRNSTKTDTAPPVIQTTAPIKSEPVKKEPTLADVLVQQEGLSNAIAVMRPHFTDSYSDIPKTALMFWEWSDVKMTWKDLMKIEETQSSLVMKDSQSTRGKRICARGMVVQIFKHPEQPMFHGTFNFAYSKFLRFLAAKSTGNLVENSPARFCGIVVGTHSYPNVSGGETQGILAVGMFDLPENK